MLQIIVPEMETYDEATNRIVKVPEKELRLEHSLVSISKWESKWKKPFLGNSEMTFDETIDYIRCMTITQNVPISTYSRLSVDNINKVKEYINDSMTATWFSKKQSPSTNGRNSIITSEVIYWQMIALEIPFECQTWHLNRLLTLIRVCAEKQKPDKKMSGASLAKYNRNLNAARRAKLGSRG